MSSKTPQAIRGTQDIFGAEAEAFAFDANVDAGGASVPVEVPGFMKEIVAELSQLARRSSVIRRRALGQSRRVVFSTPAGV